MVINNENKQYLKKILIKLIEKPEEFLNLPEVLQNSYKFILLAVSLNGDIYKFLDKKYQNQKEIIIAQILHYGNYCFVYDNLPPKYKEDSDIKLALESYVDKINKYNEVCEKIKIDADEYDKVPAEWKRDIIFNCWAIESNSSVLLKVPNIYQRPPEIKSAYLLAKKNELIEKIKINVDEYNEVPSEWKTDFYFICKAIKANPLVLKKIHKESREFYRVLAPDHSKT